MVVVVVVVGALLVGALVVGAVFVAPRLRARGGPEIATARDEMRRCHRELEAAKADRETAASGERRQLDRILKERGKAVAARQRELSQLSDPKGRRLAKQKGVTLYELWIDTPHGGCPVAGMTASVDSQPSKRITVTRLATMGFFALALQKKTGALYLSLDSPELASVIEYPQTENKAAREFAVKIMNAARGAETIATGRPGRIAASHRALDSLHNSQDVPAAQARLAAVEADPALRARVDAAQEAYDRAAAWYALLKHRQ